MVAFRTHLPYIYPSYHPSLYTSPRQNQRCPVAVTNNDFIHTRLSIPSPFPPNPPQMILDRTNRWQRRENPSFHAQTHLYTQLTHVATFRLHSHRAFLWVTVTNKWEFLHLNGREVYTELYSGRKVGLWCLCLPIPTNIHVADAQGSCASRQERWGAKSAASP